MGRIVINKTENGQTVILNDTAQEVNGGYFDKEMEWHEFGDSGSEFINVTVSVTETSTHSNIQLLNVLKVAPDGFQSCGDALIHPGKTLNIKVLKNSFVTDLYETETSWLKLVSGTGKTFVIEGNTFLYFDEDGQTAVLDYFYKE